MISDPPFRLPRWPPADGQQYRLYFLDGVGHITKSHDFFAADDAAAIKISEGWHEGRRIELWQHARQGNDFIFSYQSADNDLLYGESGADTFHFDTFTSAQVIGYVPSTSATIMDFQTGVDTIDLHLFGISTNDHTLYWLGQGGFTGANRLEVNFQGGTLQVDYNGDRIPDLILNIVGTIAPTDFTYTFDPWGY